MVSFPNQGVERTGRCVSDHPAPSFLAGRSRQRSEASFVFLAPFEVIHREIGFVAEPIT
jgi:hypothetical protein